AEGTWWSVEVMPPFRPAVDAFREPGHFAALLIFLHAGNLPNALGALFALAVLDRLLRARWLALAAWGGVFLAVSWPALAWGSDWRMAAQSGVAQVIIAGVVLNRFGPLALAAMLFTRDMLTRAPAALEFSAWYSDRSLIALAIVLAIGLY